MARAALAGVLMCVLALTGCAAIASMSDLNAELRSAGYEVSGMHQNSMNGHDVLSIEATMADAVPTDSDADRIAEIVWTKYPPVIDELVVTINGQQFMDASADELTERFGERTVSQPAGRGGNGVPVTAVIVVAVVALLLAGLVVLVWWRGKRNPPPVPRPTYPGMYPQPYQPLPYQPQPYQPQSPYQPQPPSQPLPPPTETQPPTDSEPPPPPS